MNPFTIRLGGLLATALAAILLLAVVPAGADAAPKKKDVRKAAAAARAAVDGALDAAAEGKTRRAEARIGKAERFAAKARRKAARLDGARAFRVAAAGSDYGFDSIADLIGVLPPEVQDRFADALERFAGIREAALERLAELAAQLPEPARSKLLAAIAAFHDDGDLEALIETITDPEISEALRERLTGILGDVSGHLDSLLDRLGDLGAVLPPGVGADLDELIGSLEEILAGVFGMLDDILGGLPGSGSGGGGFPGLPGLEFPGGICDILGGMPFPLPLPICQGA